MSEHSEHAGRNVRRIRREREMTQAQLARPARIPQQQLSAYENGLRMPVTVVKRIARILGVHPDDLLEAPLPSSAALSGRVTSVASV